MNRITLLSDLHRLGVPTDTFDNLTDFDLMQIVAYAERVGVPKGLTSEQALATLRRWALVRFIAA